MGQELSRALEKLGRMESKDGMAFSEQETPLTPGREDLSTDENEKGEITNQSPNRKESGPSETSVNASEADSTTNANSVPTAERNSKKFNIDANKKTGSNTCTDSSYAFERNFGSSERNSKSRGSLNLTDSKIHDRIQPANDKLENYPLPSGSCARLGKINSPLMGYKLDSTHTPSRGRNCNRSQSRIYRRDCTQTGKPRNGDVTYIKRATSPRTRYSGERGLRRYESSVYCRNGFRNMSNVERKSRSNDYNGVNLRRKREGNSRFSSLESRARLTEGQSRSSANDRRESRRYRSHSRDHSWRDNPDYRRAKARRTSNEDHKHRSSHSSVSRDEAPQAKRKPLKRKYDGKNSVSPHRHSSRSKRYSGHRRKHCRQSSSSSSSVSKSNSESANEDKKEMRSKINRTFNVKNPDEGQKTDNTKTIDSAGLENVLSDIQSFSNQITRDKNRGKQTRSENAVGDFQHHEDKLQRKRIRVEIESVVTSGTKDTHCANRINRTNPSGGQLEVAASVEDPAQVGNDFGREDKSNEDRAPGGEILLKDPPVNEVSLGATDESASPKSWSCLPEHSDISTFCDQAISVPDCQNSAVSGAFTSAGDPFPGCVGTRLERPIPPASLIRFLSVNLPDRDLDRLRGLIGLETTSRDDEWLLDQLERSLYLSAVRSLTDVTRWKGAKAAESTEAVNSPSPDESTTESLDPSSSSFGVRDTPWPLRPPGEEEEDLSGPDAPSPGSDESMSLFSPSPQSQRSDASTVNCARKEKSAGKDQKSTRVEKVATAVKKVALPLFFQQKITKEEYKQVMRQVVSQILRSKDNVSGDLLERNVHRWVISAASALK